MSDDRLKRQQSQTERDIEGWEARKQRERARSNPLGIPAVTCDDVTGNYEGEELARARARRPTPERLERLEKGRDEDRGDHKKLVEKVDGLSTAVARVEGKLDLLPKLVSLLEGKEETKRQGMANRTKIILGLLSLLGSGGIGAIIAALSGCAS